MIKEVRNEKEELAVTSDRWHVIHARWSGDSGAPLFVRSIVSEHADSATALRAGRELKSSLLAGMASRPRLERDQVMVRRPASESVKTSGRVSRRRSK
jgi:hypothetical protein